jgi:hypothetical protein
MGRLAKLGAGAIAALDAPYHGLRQIGGVNPRIDAA